MTVSASLSTCVITAERQMLFFLCMCGLNIVSYTCLWKQYINLHFESIDTWVHKYFKMLTCQLKVIENTHDWQAQVTVKDHGHLTSYQSRHCRLHPGLQETEGVGGGDVQAAVCCISRILHGTMTHLTHYYKEWGSPGTGLWNQGALAAWNSS